LKAIYRKEDAVLLFFAKRLKELHEVERDERGFTLIELLVVPVSSVNKDDRDQEAAQGDEYARTGEPLELLALYASPTPVACHQCDGREEHRRDG